MEESNQKTEQEILSTEQIRCYSASLKKFFLYQSGRGFWGRGNIENKVTYTSQAIQLMQTLGVNHNEKKFKRAVRWLEDNIEKVESHWATRVEVGLKINDLHKLADEQHIDEFLNDLEYDLEHSNEEQRLDLFWDVIPTLIALHPYESECKERRGKPIPHEKVIKKIIDNSTTFNDTITVEFQANHTGLVALYLSTISDILDVSDDKNKMINWILMNREENASYVSWQRGRGITAYVLIDLLGCKLEKDKIKKIVPKVIRFIIPNSKGNIKRDKVTTYDTKLHAEPLYISMLVLRAITEVLKMEDINKVDNIRHEISQYTWYDAFFAKIKRFFYYNKKKMPIIICIFLCIIGILFYVIKVPFIASLFVTIGVSSILTYIFQILDRD